MSEASGSRSGPPPAPDSNPTAPKTGPSTEGTSQKAACPPPKKGAFAKPKGPLRRADKKRKKSDSSVVGNDAKTAKSNDGEKIVKKPADPTMKEPDFIAGTNECLVRCYAKEGFPMAPWQFSVWNGKRNHRCTKKGLDV